MKKKYEYRIVIFENKSLKKIIKRGRSYKKIKQHYNKLLKDSKKVVFPQNFKSNQSENQRIVHEVSIITNDPTRKEYIGFNDKRIKLKNEEYKVIFLENYNIEEKFYTYPDQRQKDFFTIADDLKKINGIVTSYQINNKIVFENIIDIQYMIVCKDQFDADILYNILRNHKLTPYMYIGKMTQNTMKMRAKKIMQRFNISYKRFHNTRTKA